jgi:hypothetical protein
MSVIRGGAANRVENAIPDACESIVKQRSDPEFVFHQQRYVCLQGEPAAYSYFENDLNQCSQRT